jgi:hypothetical protein
LKRFAVFLVPALALAATPDGGRMIDEQFSAMEQRAIDEAWEQLQRQLADAGTPKHPPFKWRFDKAVSTFKVDGTVEIEGIPVRMQGVKVKSTLIETLMDLRAEFLKQGLWMEDFNKQPQIAAQTQITALDVDRFISYTALVEPLADKVHCRVLIGEANLAVGAQVRKARAGQADFVALPDGAQTVMRSKSEGLETLSYATQMSEKDTIRFFDDQLAVRGFQRIAPGHWQLGTTEIKVRTGPVSGKTGVMLMKTGAAAPSPK